MMQVQEFLSQVRKAVNSKTLYVMGGFGAPAGYGNNRTRYMNNNDYNRQPDRQAKISRASDDTFFFDCVGLCKGVLWGWDALAGRVYGGADYGSNGVPDYDAKMMMFSGCTDPTTDFSKIDPGEFLWLDGHCGIYLGDGLAAESTPIWADGVQITAVANLGSKKGYNSRTWTYHGHLKYVDYKASGYKSKWVKVDGKWYYYDKDGVMVTSDWVRYKGAWYYLGDDGAMLTGWYIVDQVEYYFHPDGHMAQDEWIDGIFLGMDGRKYKHKGEWKSDKKGKWWESDGCYPRGRSVRIDNKDCAFDKKGYLIV